MSGPDECGSYLSAVATAVSPSGGRHPPIPEISSDRAEVAWPRWLAVVATFAVACTLLGVTWRIRVASDAVGQDHILANGDLFTEFYPMFEASFSSLRSGRLFLWNSHQLCGLPGLATLQFGALYPPHLVYLILSVPTGMEVLALLHLFLGMISAILLGRALSLSWAGSLVVGTCFGLSGTVLANILWPNAFETVAWLPLGIAAVIQILRDKGSIWAIMLTVAVAMSILAGGYQYTVYNLYAFFLCAACGGIVRLVPEWRVRPLLPAVVTLALAVVVGVALAMPQLLPTLELTGQSAREANALRPDQVQPFGRLFTWSSMASGVLLPTADPHRPYIGAVPIVLAAAGLLCRSGMAVPFAALMVAWGALGLVTPDWFIQFRSWVPALAWFRLPFRVRVLGNLGVAMLAGLAFDALWKPSRRTRWHRGLSSAVVFITGGVAAAMVRYPQPSWVLPAGLALIGGLSYLAHGVRSRVALALVVLALCVIDVQISGRNTFHVPWMGESWQRLRQHSAVWSDTRQRAGLFRILNVGPGLDYSWTIKAATLEGVYSPVDYEPLALSRYGDFFEYATSEHSWPAERNWKFTGDVPPGFWGSTPARVRRFLSLLSVRYLLLPRPALHDAQMARFAANPAIVAVQAWGDPRAPEFVLFENRDALPRAYTVSKAECFSRSGDQLARLASPSFNPRETVVLEGTCAGGDSAAGSMEEAHIDHYEDMLVRIAVDTTRPRFLVLTDSYYPGWEARVNGTAERIWRANAVLRAVRVPAGHSEVEFRYVPHSFYMGTIIAVVTIGLVLMFWGRHAWIATKPGLSQNPPMIPDRGAVDR